MAQIDEVELQNHMSRISMYMDIEEKNLSKVQSYFKLLHNHYQSECSSDIEDYINHMENMFYKIKKNRSMYIHLLAKSLQTYKENAYKTEQLFKNINVVEK